MARCREVGDGGRGAADALLLDAVVADCTGMLGFRGDVVPL